MQSCPLSFQQQPSLLENHVLNHEELNRSTDFLKLAALSPDGSSFLTVSENSWIDVHDFNADTLGLYKYYGKAAIESSSGMKSMIATSRSFHIGESVYDCKWYPLMNAQDTGTNCFVVTSRDHPISLLDGINGKLRATYSGINHLDELDSAISLAFNMSGDRLYSGSNKMIRCFDISQPGKASTSIPTTKSKKALLGQKGLISTLIFNPDYSGVYAAGSYAHSVGLYVENSKENVMQLDQLPYAVTCLKWSPCGKYLWSGGRCNDSIQCWDIRSTGSCVGEVKRPLRTQQRISFDIDPWGELLVTGSQDGDIIAYNIKTFEQIKSFKHDTHRNNDNSGNCVNSVQFHPYSSILCSVQGERSFHNVGCDDPDSDSETNERAETKELNIVPNSSIRFWSIDCETIDQIVETVEMSS